MEPMRNTDLSRNPVMRAAVAATQGHVTPNGAEQFLARDPSDRASPIIYRASQEVGTTGGVGWASEVAQTATLDFVSGLGPASAASQLFALAMRAEFPAGHAGVNVPGVIPAASAGGFVAEDGVIPCVGWNLQSASLEGKKLGAIAVISRELAKASRAEAVINQLLTESAALALDSALFSDTAASAASSAGLFYGLTSISAGAWDADPLTNDLAALAAAVAPVAGDQIAFVTNPARALQISVRAPNLRYPVLASAALPDTRLAAVGIKALAFAVDPDPDIMVSGETVTHMSTTPGEIVNDAGAVADPVRSLWQTAAIGIRLMLRVDWGLRAPGAVKVIDGLAW